MLSTEKQVGLMRIEMVETGLSLVFKNGKEGKKRKGEKRERRGRVGEAFLGGCETGNGSQL